jgi:hypothetical protein
MQLLWMWLVCSRPQAKRPPNSGTFTKQDAFTRSVRDRSKYLPSLTCQRSSGEHKKRIADARLRLNAELTPTDLPSCRSEQLGHEVIALAESPTRRPPNGALGVGNFGGGAYAGGDPPLRSSTGRAEDDAPSTRCNASPYRAARPLSSVAKPRAGERQPRTDSVKVRISIIARFRGDPRTQGDRFVDASSAQAGALVSNNAP